MKDYYQVLGVGKQASEDEIKKAYRKLARQYHPDTHPNDKAAEARFKEINEAHEILGDPDKRKQYDMLRANPLAGGFGRQAGHGGFGANPGFGGLDDILSSLFRQNARPQPARGNNVEVDAEISLEDAVKGTTVTMTVTPSHGGPKRLKVSIPPGAATGTKVRVAGEGDPGAGGGAPGDLFVRLSVRPHPRFTREGDDLLYDLPLSVFDAVLGAEVTVPTIEGEVKLKIPPGTQGGTVFRLKNKGVPQLKGSGRGALLVKLNIQIPEQIGEREREAWRQLAGREAFSGRK